MIYLSFTTTPDRIKWIQPMIHSIESQRFKDFKPILWLCNHYKRSNRFYSIEQVPNFVKNSSFDIKFCSDYGSNTKLIPLLQYIQDPEAILITADDDTCYPTDWLQGLVEASKDNKFHAYGYRGKIFDHAKSWLPPFSRIKRIRYEHTQTIMPKDKSEESFVDMLTGVWGICYRRSFFTDDYYKLDVCPSAYHNDDIWANGHLARKGIFRKCLSIKSSFSDIQMETHGVKRLWDSVNNGKGLNNKVLKYFDYDFQKPCKPSLSS